MEASSPRWRSNRKGTSDRKTKSSDHKMPPCITHVQLHLITSSAPVTGENGMTNQPKHRQDARQWLNVLVRRLISQSPQAICCTLKIQSSLDDRPHWVERSQSAQTKSRVCSKGSNSLLKKPRKTCMVRIFFLFLNRNKLGWTGNELP